MSHKTVAAGLALMLVLAGCGHRTRSADAAAPSTPAGSTPAATGAPAGQSGPVAAPILSPVSTSSTSATASRPATPSARAVTAAQLLSAPVPSLCRHAPGRLVRGRLPGIPAGMGVVRLASLDGYRADDPMTAFGDLDGDGVAEAAVTFDCDRGGVTWPDELVFYGPGPTILGSFDMSAATGSTRVGVRQVSITGGTVTVSSLERLSDEGECCASGRALVTLRWNGSKVVLAGVAHLPGPTTIGTSQIGPVRLGMTARQLGLLGYHAGTGAGGCLTYTAAGKPSVSYDPARQRAVAITTTVKGAYRTYLGGFVVGDQLTLSRLRAAFPRYLVTSYLTHDFGQGASGVTVTDPARSGSIGFVLAAAPDATGQATITAIRVGRGVAATANPPSCR